MNITHQKLGTKIRKDENPSLDEMTSQRRRTLAQHSRMHAQQLGTKQN